MEDPRSYPQNTVWYVEASPEGEAVGESAVQQGSAVAVCLRPRGQVGKHERFLLTCQHLVRGKTAEGVKGWGDPLRVIKCYHPNKGFMDPLTARPAVISPLQARDVPEELRRPARDWVLLKVDDQKFQDAPYVGLWEPGWRRAHCRVIGFPRGRSAFADGIVTSRVSPSMEMRIVPEDGAFEVTGEGSRSGMSGGAVFAADGAFLGLHQARTDSQLALHGVAAWHIRAEIEALGWEVVVAPTPDQLLERALLACGFVKDAAVFDRLLPLLGTLRPAGLNTAEERACWLVHAAADQDKFFGDLLDALRRHAFASPSFLLYAELDERFPRDVKWQWLEQLKNDILQPEILEKLGETQLAAVLATKEKLCAGVRSPFGADADGAEEIACGCLNQLARLSPPSEGNHPLMEFLLRHRVEFGLSPTDLQRLALRWGWKPPVMPRPTRLRGASQLPPAVLQIVVAKGLSPEGTYLLKAYLEEGDEVDNLPLTDLEQSVDADKLSEEISRIAEAAREKVRHRQRLVRVELFLPSELMLVPLEQTAGIEVDLGEGPFRQPIGEAWPIVVRSYERQANYHPEIENYQAIWEQKWQSAQGAQASAGQVPWACANFAPGRGYERLFSDVERLGFMTLWPIAGPPLVGMGAFMRGVWMGGLPVGLWVRETPDDPDAARARFDAALRTHRLGEWPERVRGLRLAAPPTESTRQGLTLFYDRSVWNDPEADAVGELTRYA